VLLLWTLNAYVTAAISSMRRDAPAHRRHPLPWTNPHAADTSRIPTHGGT
jgi:hypothetical protein